MSATFKTVLLFIAFGFIQLDSFAQVKFGSDLVGDSLNDEFGYSVSMPDEFTVAVGAPGSDGFGFDSGYVKVYKLSNNSWVQKGLALKGDSANGGAGVSISMPDSNTIAIGNPYHFRNGSKVGFVSVYKWDGSTWMQKGLDITGEFMGDRCGFSVSMPDSNTIAISAILNHGAGTEAGHVRIYEWNGNSWLQKGNDIDGDSANNWFGYSISMPDNEHVAIGAPFNVNNGHVRIYQWNGNAWVQKGLDIEGESTGGDSGWAVSMPDSNTVAIGDPDNDDNAYNAGHVRIYKWRGNSWIQKGSDIDGAFHSNYFGRAIDMPDSNTIAVGAPYDFWLPAYGNRVQVYHWDDTVWVQKGENIEGEFFVDETGWSVSMPTKDIVAVGIPYKEGGGSGYTRVYSFCNTTDTINEVACISYVSPSGKYTWTLSDTYQDTLANAENCDSIIVINLTVYNNSTDSMMVQACENYTSPSSKYTWLISGTYQDTIQNSVGCDSLITINLIVNNNSSATISPIVCDNYISPSGNYTWNASGTYQDTVANVAGCDSLITINLTVSNSSYSTIAENACSSYTSPSGKFTWTSTGIYQDTVPNVVGCDSIITINLTIQNTSSNISPVVCNDYMSPSGNYYWATSGIYYDTIPNSVGCDSLITIDLTVNDSTSAVINPIACETYTSPSGNYTWTTSGIYQDTILNSVGCDSLITINLIVNDQTSATIAPTVCDYYVSPSGNYNWITSGTYQDTIANLAGCDSLITINLTVNNSSYATITENACSSYTSPSGKHTWTSTGTYSDTISNFIGCDSIITVQLNIQNTTANISPIVCNDYMSPSGNYYWSTSGTYQDTILNSVGCDSLITINLTVNDSTSAAINPIACKTYTSPSGNYVWTSSGIYSDVITNSQGCDSILTINLTVKRNSTAIITPTVCNNYVSPSGNYNWTTSGTYQDTIANAAGCDSLITINLTVNNSSSASISPTVCESFTSPSGNYTWTTTGTYTDTVPNSIGCDSIITVHLSIQNSTVSISPVVCNSYTSPSGNNTWMSSGTYHDTIPNATGCDSIITINLTVNQTINTTVSASTCGTYTSPSGKHTWTSSGTYLDTLTNAGGCDSILTINLTINDHSSSMINAVACNRYFSPSGNYVWINSGTYQDIIPNALGCDSIITINLTIHNTTLATINPVVCDSFTSPSGKYTWTINGSYIDTLQNTVGCDSLIGINLTVEPINTSISISNDSLIAADTNATYQWLDCGNNYSVIPGATNRVFEPTVSGNYALTLNKLNCSDTSVCQSIVITSLKNTTAQKEQITIYPNPSNGLFTIEYPFTNESKIYTVSDINGKVVREEVINKEKTQLDLSEFVSGIYLLRIEDAVFKLVLN